MNENNSYKLPWHPNKIFEIDSDASFNKMALDLFHFQYANNAVYHDYCDLIKIEKNNIDHYSKIPFLPISFFKTHDVKCFEGEPEIVFTSSGTGGINSRHEIFDLKLYEISFMQYFTAYFGDPKDYIFLGLLPSYLERTGSSLIYMVDHLIQASQYSESGFFLNEDEKLLRIIADNKDKKIILFGVTYALLDLLEEYHPDLSGCIILETGGMKGKRKELTKDVLHETLKAGFNVKEIYSEYGMTELLSQAYSTGTQFSCPPWMKFFTREYNDPFNYTQRKSGGINIIDLANIHSCAFIETQDLGKITGDHIEILGRYDNADLRGCNFLVQ